MKFDHILADPDWWYNKRLNEQHGGNRTRFGDGVWFKYATPPSDLATICSMPVESLAEDNCFLHLWTTGPHLFDAKDVMEAWGFKFLTIEFVLIKISKQFIKECLQDIKGVLTRLLAGENIYDILIKGTRKLPGNYTASNVEIVLIGKRGKPIRSDQIRMFPQLIFTPLPKIPHTKPTRVQEYIDSSWPDGKKIELYARRYWKDWVCLGNELPNQEGTDMKISIPLTALASQPPSWAILDGKGK